MTLDGSTPRASLPVMTTVEHISLGCWMTASAQAWPPDSEPAEGGARPPPQPAVSSTTGTDWASITVTLTGYARGLTRSEHDAQDLVQRTIARLLEREPARAGHLGLAYTTMTRLWLDDHRRLRRRATRLLDHARTLVHASTQIDRLEHDELVERVRRAIHSLGPRQRAVLVLRVMEGLSYPEIAEHLGCSVDAVRASLHLARARVRTLTGESP